MADEDHEHWPDDAKLQKLPAAAAAGYDGHNGLREHIYYAPGAVKEKKKEPAPEEPKAMPAPPEMQYYPGQYYPQMPWMGPPPPMQYASYGAYGELFHRIAATRVR